MKKYLIALVLTLTPAISLAQSIEKKTPPTPEENQKAPVMAQGPDGTWHPAQCQDFHKNPDGSWSPNTTIHMNGITAGSGTTFSSGVSFSGINLGAQLNQKCS